MHLPRQTRRANWTQFFPKFMASHPRRHLRHSRDLARRPHAREHGEL